MERVLEEFDHVAADFNADAVHDLRVSLRRCRSMADGMMAMDPDPAWKAMRKAGKRLFQRLGELRDVQIMMEWIEKLAPAVAAPAVVHSSQPAMSSGSPDPAAHAPHESASHEPVKDPAGHALLGILKHREHEQKREAQEALEEFDRKQWRHWAKALPQRAARVPLGSPLFKHLALERWCAARELHNRALRNRSQVAYHTLRIGIKRFRYIVENFLPDEHKAWSNDLKEVQDLLGEVHDLDVLWAAAISGHVFADEESRKRWHERIVHERSQRITRYRVKMTGPGSLWPVWRAALPEGKQIQAVATRRLKLWAKALDPDFAHSERVSRLALELYDGLNAAGLLKVGSGGASGNGVRGSLALAALLHDVGKSQGQKGHHKASLDLIKTHGVPMGWTPEEMQRAAIVARFHCGALPTRSHKALRDLLPDEQKTVMQLAGVLRLANAFDAAHDGQIRRVRIENAAVEKRRTNGFVRKPLALGRNEALVIGAEGYAAGSPTAQTIAAERYLLETVLRRPVVVKAVPGARHSAPVSQGTRAAS
jgi:CHAD domain-containing protein/HD superfamily phosphodiesterase